MKLNKILTLILLLFLCPRLYGQEILALEDKEYLLPIKIKGTVQLSGNMGELRKTHFHSGIDIKTQGKTGFPIISTMEGCVARVKITQKGYGKALYVFDKNGNTNVYAHLNEFYDALEQHIIKTQYQKESFEVDFQPKKCSSYPVKKGEVLGLSGNTGGSSGPHLHFEIRDNNQCPLDPLEYNFKQIKDIRPPRLKKIAFIPMDIQSSVNGNQDFCGPYTITKNKNKYTLQRKVQAIGTIGIALKVDDYHNGSGSRLGVKDIKLYDNDSLILHQEINNFCFNETKDIVLFYEYEQYIKTNTKLYSLYKNAGNKFNFYNTLKNNGKINVHDKENHKIKIVAEDAYGNASELEFTIFGSDKNEIKPKANKTFKDKIYIKNDYLVLETKKRNKKMENKLYNKGEKYDVLKIKDMQYKSIYYMPWNSSTKSFGDSLLINNKAIIFKKYIKLSPDKDSYHGILEVNENGDNIQYTIVADKRAVKKSTYITHSFNLKEKTLQIGTSANIFFTPLKINMCPHDAMDINAKIGVFKVVKNKYEFVPNEIEDDGLKFQVNEGGRYTVKVDKTSPTIKPLVVSQKRLRFMVDDLDSGIKSYRCTIDNQWVLLEYDYKTKTLKSNKKDPHFPLEKGTLQLLVIDNMDNEKIYTKKLL